MSAFHDRRNEALSGYRDLRDFTPPPPPVCQAEADRLAELHRRDDAERQVRIARQVVAEKADKRARSARDYATEIQDLANRLAHLIAAARTDGFGVVGAEEMKDLARNAVWLLREQQERVHG